MSKHKHIHIIGGGLAGLSAAYYASAQADNRVTLYEASPHLGGRCRSYFDEKLQTRLDNGNHVLIGACPEGWALIDALGCREHFHTPPHYYQLKDIKNAEEWCLRPPFRLNAKLSDYGRLLRLMIAPSSAVVSDYFPAESAFYHRVITPLCLSALNTQPHRASAQLFALMLRRCGMRTHNYRPYLPKSDWGSALIEPLAKALTLRGVTLHKDTSLKGFETQGERIARLDFATHTAAIAPEETVIFALPAPALQKLLPNTPTPTSYESIINGHFRMEGELPPNASMVGLVGGSADWVFQKGTIASTTTSAASRIHTDNVAQALWNDVKAAFNLAPALPIPPHRIVHEKRATFEATPENCQRRSAVTSAYANLFLAGDHTNTGLPATIEGAIASGKRAAALAKPD